MKKKNLCVAIINSATEIIELLQQFLEEEGFKAVTALISDIKKGNLELSAFLREYEPVVIIYDVPPPYDRNWEFFKKIEASPQMRDCSFVVTTTNKKALEAQVGNTPTIELVGKPYDLGEILNAVNRAIDKKS